MSRRTDPASRARALSTLSVTESQLSVYPTITHSLIEIGKVMRGKGQSEPGSRAPYGMGGDIRVSWPQYLRMAADDPAAQQVLGAYAQVTKGDRHAVPIEAYCLAANVAPARILELITVACMRMNATASQLIASVNHPRVVQHNVKRALDEDGEKWTEMLHKATGFLPTSKGPSQTVHVHASATSTAQAASIVPAPAAESTIRRMVDRFNDARPVAALPPTSAVEIPSTTEHVPVAVEIEDD